MGADRQSPSIDTDVILVGGGLSSCLIALWLSEDQPETRVTVLEAGDEICGNHTWSFHTTDLAPEDYQRIKPVIEHAWPGQKVLFPAFERELPTGYASITSDALRECVYGLKSVEVREKTPVESLKRDHVILQGGARLDAPCVIDARGFVPNPALKLGFQKFLGQELELEQPHGERVPTIMDARVTQLDGYRFVYLLPFSPTRILVEDTRYSDGGDVNDEAFRDAIQAYAKDKGWTIRQVVREERGVLPITLAMDVERFWQDQTPDVAPVGLRAGLFQPTTGYSLPDAVRVARLISNGAERPTTESVFRSVRAYAKESGSQQPLYRFLNRMLFQAAKPHERYLVLQRFYGLSQGLIERFYAGRLTRRDKLRILVGKPPLPIHRALRCVSESKALAES